ncbi:MAG TPA: sigma-70 family RNA polymerase sigma factor [Terriglobales bacterium]|nr:sigma-70 family RNA polymerase sigma factor [Terriglobales bacterium]
MLSTLTQVIPISSSVPVPTDWEDAYRQYHGNVYRAAYQVTGNAADAEDVLQTVFLRLWRRTPESANVDNLRSYLYRAAINASLDLLRARQEEKMVQPLDEIDVADGASGQDETVMLRSWLRSALAKLNPKHAEMFALRYLQELDNREIAKIMGTSQAVVAITLFRIRKQLQNDFKMSSQARTGK